jgi:O-antigen ligase
LASVTSLAPSRGTPVGPRAAAVLLGVAAVIVGGLATTSPLLAAALVASIAIILCVLRDLSALTYLLCATVFVESLSLGHGLRVGRIAGALALLVIAMILLIRGVGGLRVGWLLAVAGAYGFWIVASIEWASAPQMVPSEAFSFVLSASYTLALALLVRRREHAIGLSNTLALGASIFGVVAFVHYLRHAGGGSVNDLSERSAGLQGDPNYFAVVQVIALPPTLVLAALDRRRFARLLYFAAIGIIVVSVVSSLSRTGLLALGAVVTVTMILPWRVFFTAAREKGWYLASIIAGGLAASTVSSSTLLARIRTIINPNAQGSYRGAGREDLWRAALHGWRDSNEIVGMGAGNFRFHSLDLLQTTPGVDTTQNYVRPLREVHNAYLENLADLGVVGLTLFVVLIGLTGFYLVRSYRRAASAEDFTLQRLSLAFMVSLVGYSISAVFLSNQLAKALWILTGIALAFDVMSRRALESRRLADLGPEEDETG